MAMAMRSLRSLVHRPHRAQLIDNTGDEQQQLIKIFQFDKRGQIFTAPNPPALSTAWGVEPLEEVEIQKGVAVFGEVFAEYAPRDSTPCLLDNFMNFVRASFIHTIPTGTPPLPALAAGLVCANIVV